MMNLIFSPPRDLILLTARSILSDSLSHDRPALRSPFPSSLHGHGHRLEDAEDIALRVLAVGQPPHARNLLLGLDDLPPVVGYSREGPVNGLDPDGADISLNTVAGPRFLASQNAPVYSHLLTGAGPHKPVIEGAVPLPDLPAEYVPIESGGALRIVGVDFKMNYSGHSSIIGAVGGYRFLSGCRMGWAPTERSRVVWAFPNDRSLLRLAVAILMDINEERLTGRKYLSMEEN